MAKVFVKPRRARPFWFGHPWVFSGAVERVRGQVRDGDVVQLCDDRGREIGRGFFNSKGQIRVRLVALADETQEMGELLRDRLRRALHLRRKVLRLPEITNAYRLVHGDGDGLPGFVVDVIDRWLVIQVSCLGLLPHLDDLLALLEDELKPIGIIERAAGHMAEEEGITREPGIVLGEGPTGPVMVNEAGVTYVCDPVEGQKTGFYSDQRENRIALAPFARDKDVLDAFSYVGGFGLRMAAEGAKSVTLIDSSASALDMARQGAEANGFLGRVAPVKGNVLRVLDHYRQDGRRFDLVVVDPPALVPRLRDQTRGLRLYSEINRKALTVLHSGGLLVTCSCSRNVPEDAFDEMLAATAKDAAVRLQEIYRAGQGPDHPVLLPLDESRYLKVRAFMVWRG